MNLKHRRRFIRLASFALAALLVMGGLLWRSEKSREICRNYVEASWERAFASLSSDLTQIDTALKKCRVSSSPAVAWPGAFLCLKAELCT